MCSKASNTPAVHLPAELWITVFEQFSDAVHDVHIFKDLPSRRLDDIRQLQKLQNVCTAWRDMIRPLAYRHIAIAGLKSFYLMYFIEEWDKDKDFGGQRRLWIQTVVLRPEKRDGLALEAARGTRSFEKFLAQLTCMSEFACYTTLSAADVELFVAASHKTLRKLLVDLDDKGLCALLYALPRLHAIQDLSITCELWCYHAELPDIPDEALYLPHLRRLELYSHNVGVHFLLRWFFRVSPSNLEFLKVVILRLTSVTRGLLFNFLTTHGANLSTLSMGGPSFRFGTTDLLALTPRLQHLELLANYESIAMFLDKLPAPVEEVTLSWRLGRLNTPWTLMADLFRHVEQLPRPHKVRVLRVAHQMEAREIEKASWRGLTKGMKGTREELNRVVELMRHFEELGITVMDEEDLPLKTYILAQLETGNFLTRCDDEAQDGTDAMED